MKPYKVLMNSMMGSKELRMLTKEESGRLKKCLIEIYVDIKNVCDKYHLELLLLGGSALGAVRHKGFIPWDDDLDISLSRRDYKIFKKVFEKELGEHYILSAPNYKGLAKNRFPQILKKNTKLVSIEEVDSALPTNIYVDLFVLESMPDNKIHRLIKGILCTAVMFIASRVQFYECQNSVLKKYICRTTEGKLVYFCRSFVGKLFSFQIASKWFDIVDKLFQYSKNSSLLGIPSGRKHFFGEILSKDSYFPVSTAVFEGMDVKIPGNWDSYLKNLYGDYMKIPPLEKREQHFIYEIDFEKE